MHAGMPAYMNASMPAVPWPGKTAAWVKPSDSTHAKAECRVGHCIRLDYIVNNTCRTVNSGMSKSGSCSRSRSPRRPSKGREKQTQLADRTIPADGHSAPGARKVRACDANRLPALLLTRCSPAPSNPLAMMAIAALLAPGLSGCGGEGGQSVGEVIDDVRVVEIIDEGTVVEVMDKVTPAFGTRSRGNPTAEDLLDHWNEAERLRARAGRAGSAGRRRETDRDRGPA